MIDVQLIQEYGAVFLSGVQLTLLIAMMSCALGISLGVILGILLSQKTGMVRWLIMAYVTIIRGTPMLIQIAATFYLLQYAGIGISALWSAILSIGLNSGAYMSQIMLSGINAVPNGQWQAAKVLGFTKYQTMRYIILPQAFKTVIPAFGNELITLVKDSSLASTISVYELSKQGEVVMSLTWDMPTVYVILACIYLMITSILSLIVSWLDKKMNNHANR